MPVKINIAEKDKTWKLELESAEAFASKNLGDIIHGKEISENLEGYELLISGASDISGFPHKSNLEGQHLRKILMSKGWGMHDSRPGVRLKKSLRGKQLSEKTSQVNLIVKKHGAKKLAEIFPEQNKAPEPVKKETVEAAPAQ